jgi:hypothetical protein
MQVWQHAVRTARTLLQFCIAYNEMYVLKSAAVGAVAAVELPCRAFPAVGSSAFGSRIELRYLRRKEKAPGACWRQSGRAATDNRNFRSPLTIGLDVRRAGKDSGYRLG